MPSYGLELGAGFGYARVHGVEADSVYAEGNSLIFQASGRTVYQIPQYYVRRIVCFDRRVDAIAWMRATMKDASRKGRLGPEGTAYRGPARSAVVELVVVVTEPR